jgi:gliding motility-associated-like protein
MKKILLAICFLVWASFAFSQAFKPGNLILFRYGDGSAALSSKTTPVFLDEYSPLGILVRSIALPVAENATDRILTGIGSQAREGLISLSVDGQLLIIPGFGTPVGLTTYAEKRTIGLVAADGTVNTSTAVSTTITTIRNVVSVDGSAFWMVGSKNFTRYIPFGFNGDTDGINLGGPTGCYSIMSFKNQLYVSTDVTGYPKVATLGTGMPATGVQTAVSLPGYPSTGSPNQFVLFDANSDGLPDLLYVADDGGTAPANATLQKYVLNGAAWEARGKFRVGGKTDNLKSITGSQSGASVNLYCTTIGYSATSTPSALLKITDEVSANLDQTAPTLTTLATAAVNQLFKSLAFAPVTSPTSPPSKPASLIASSLSATGIRLNWIDNSTNETGFEIERSSDGTNFTLFTTVAANASTYTNIGLTTSTAYYYRIRAIGSAGNSGYSNIANATTGVVVLPTVPSNLLAKASSSNAAGLNWADNSTNETGFEIERSTDGINFLPLTIVNENITAYTDESVVPNTTYHYRVRANGTDGNSAYSNISITTTPEAVKTILKVMNILSPNGDGYNDKWIIENIEKYPDNKVQVFDRAGRLIYDKPGYNNDWNGMLNGHQLAEGTYYYIITLKSAEKAEVLKGFISIVRMP